MYAFMGKILVIDLTAKTFLEISKSETFYRKYLGGSFLCAKLFEENLEVDAVPFSPGNPLVFATGLFAGGNVCGATRVNVFSVSPETTGTYLTQAGGEFGPELKRAGYDALVVKGKSEAPVYLKITTQGNSCSVEFVDAKPIWGMERVKANGILNDELGEAYRMATIGPAGENRVACANIMFEVDHYAGRGGLGAVMGSKNLKAICVKGDKKPAFKDREKLLEINKNGAGRFRDVAPDGFMGVLKNLGTFGLLALNQAGGNLPTRNFGEGHVDSPQFTDEISHLNIQKSFVGKTIPCKGCYVGCKKQYKRGSENAEKTALAEYESIAMLGPNIGLEDLTDGLNACEICNRLGLDTISTGAIIAWLMDCYDRNILSEETFGFSISFGDGKKACELIEDIALRKTKLGNLLADGLFKAVSELGDETRPYLRASRGIGLPAHMPRKKPGIGFGYLHGPNPADHMKFEHDWIVSDEGSLQSLGLEIQSRPDALDNNKVGIARITQIYYSMVDCMSLCMFVFGPGNIYSFGEMTEMVNAATGLNSSFKDLMKIGEESLQLQRKLYTQFGGKDEEFLDFLEKEIPSGPSKGAKISENDFSEARKHYYSLWNW